VDVMDGHFVPTSRSERQLCSRCGESRAWSWRHT
jgi:pentose-5-phosphate-3-epimerase